MFLSEDTVSDVKLDPELQRDQQRASRDKCKAWDINNLGCILQGESIQKAIQSRIPLLDSKAGRLTRQVLLPEGNGLTGS